MRSERNNLRLSALSSMTRTHCGREGSGSAIGFVPEPQLLLVKTEWFQKPFPGCEEFLSKIVSSICGRERIFGASSKPSWQTPRAQRDRPSNAAGSRQPDNAGGRACPNVKTNVFSGRCWMRKLIRSGATANGGCDFNPEASAGESLRY